MGRFKLKAGSHVVGTGLDRKTYHANDPRNNVVESDVNLAAADPRKWEDLHDSDEKEKLQKQIDELRQKLAAKEAEEKQSELNLDSEVVEEKAEKEKASRAARLRAPVPRHEGDDDEDDEEDDTDDDEDAVASAEDDEDDEDDEEKERPRKRAGKSKKVKSKKVKSKRK